MSDSVLMSKSDVDALKDFRNSLDSDIDKIIKEFLFHSLSESQLNDLKQHFSLKKDNTGLSLKPFMDMKLYHRVLSD